MEGRDKDNMEGDLTETASGDKGLNPNDDGAEALEGDETKEGGRMLRPVSRKKCSATCSINANLIIMCAETTSV
jgi:hypothetical protein